MALPIEIIRGESKQIIVKLRDENDDPIDLTSCTEIVASVPDATPPGLVSISLTGLEVEVQGSPLLGVVSLNFPAASTLLMGLTNYDADTNPVYTTLQLEVTITANPAFLPNIKKIENALNIVDQIS